MATINIYGKFSFDTPQDWDWTMTTSTANQIIIDGGPFREEFLGQFTYSLTDVFGTCNAVRFYVNAALVYSIDGLAVDAQQIAHYAATAGDTQSTYAYVLSGADTINDSDEGDYLGGYGGNDTINANGGNDLLAGGAGNDTLLGGAGVDSAIFSGARANYTVSLAPLTATVSDKTGAEGVDTLQSVERLVFADGGLALDVGKGEHGGDIYRLYQAAFNRAPDAGGVGFWLGQLDKGISMEAIAAGFMNSTEFHTAYGNAPSNTELVTKIYQNVLHRTPDAGGLDWYVHVLDTHAASSAFVLADISNSLENYNGTIAAIASGFSYTPYG